MHRWSTTSWQRPVRHRAFAAAPRRGTMWVSILAVIGMILAGCGAAASDGEPSSAVGLGGPPVSSSDGDFSGAQPTGTVLASSGFDVATNGFSFENYGNDDAPLNLDAQAMASLFGDQVCARGGKRDNKDDCKLVPTAKKWMKSMNDSMDGGHCFGLAGLSWALFRNDVSAQTYGASNAARIDFAGNRALQSDVASVFVTQATRPTTADMKTYAPNDALGILAAAWQRGEGFALGIANIRDGEPVDGHAITPIALTSLGDRKVGIVLYDNNFPKQPQTMVVDTVANTWTYSTAADPSDDPEAYRGGQDNPLELWPVAPMLGPQDCPFCSGTSTSDATGLDGGKRNVTGGSDFNYVYLNQQSDAKGVKIAVTDPQGQPIPGSEAATPLSGNQQAPPAVLVPRNAPFKVTIDGSALAAAAETDLSIIGPGYSYAVEKFTLEPGVIDTVAFDPATSTMVYFTNAGAAPDLTLTLDGDPTSYDFTFGGLDLPADGGAIGVSLDPTQQTVTASAHKSGPSEVDFVIERIDEQSDSQFSSEPIPLDTGEFLIVEYGKWNGQGSAVPVGIDTDGSGQITEQLVEAD